ncbi:MAG: hypothetical protein A2075_05255 [Geobacteraceae bacterium GWC2_58_44]|nr:MAG: hypothetical protein A2075_05255 [Geobacteraceae bacterium GWC2_58_44]
MQGHELVKKIQKDSTAHPERIFIKWWRKEEDYIDFDLVARFLENLNYGTEISGYDLIDQEEMWRTIERRCNGRASKVQRDGRTVVLWNPPKGAEVEERLPEYPDTPETLLKILDVESNYNYVD